MYKRQLKDRLIEDTSFHHGWIRAALYLACTPAMFGFTSILVWPGCMLVLTAFLYVLVSLKYRAGGGVPSYSQVPQAGEDEGPSFGTFTL